jgi:hypothetical protein
VGLIDHLQHDIEGEFMEQFYEMAMAEALGWIGFNYYRNVGEDTATITPLALIEDTAPLEATLH